MDAARPTVARLFEAAVARDGDAVAVVAGRNSLTYGQLDQAADRVADRLRATGVGPGTTVGVRLGRSVELAAALLGVLKAGGACVPLDPAYPADRLAFMAADAGIVALVTEDGVVEQGPSGDGPGVPVDVAYVIYTSGSTGRPKGVLLTQAGLVNHHRAVVDLYGLGPGDRVLQFCSLGFDASIEELFPSWAAGATVVFRPDDAPLLGRSWLRWLDDQRITVLNLPTAYWHAWTADLDALGAPVPDDVRLVVVGGEKALGPAYRTWRRVSGGRSRWVNAYGPTETTCMSTWFEPSGAEGDGDPPIGRPLPDTSVLVVDDGRRPVEPGSTGELLIGGAGLARGYLGHPELTAERFVDVPGAGRMYRTGDVVRALPTGDLDFVGRIDDQVKIRGFRVEPGEVEAALARHPAVAATAVVAREHPPGDTRLVAYVVSRPGAARPAAAELRRFLAGQLPAHMVPAAFAFLDALPLTANGKVDRAALPSPEGAAAGGGRTRSRSPAEDVVAAVWARVLGLDPADLGPDDDFFDLGGHSLLATQVIAQLRDEFDTDTPLRTIFEAPSLAGLAAAVTGTAATAALAGGGARLVARSRPPGTPVPLSLAQEQMWGLEQAASPPGLYNVTALHRFDGPVSEGALREALAYLVDRHEILRTAFGVDEAGRPYQSPVAAADVDVAVAHLDGAGGVAAQDAAPFGLARPPLLRAGLYPRGDGSTGLAVTFDHLVCDGTGAAIFMQELGEAYAAVVGGRRPSLSPLRIQFSDFADWQRSTVTADVLRRQLEWWAHALDGMALGPAVPFDRTPSTPTRRIEQTSVATSPETRAGLDALARATGSTVFTVAAAAVSALLGRHGATSDVAMSTTLSGRTRTEAEGLVGLFSGIGRIRADLSADPPFAELVARTRDFVLGLFENQDIPFMQVRRALFPEFPTGGPALAAALPVEFQFFHVADEPELHFRGQLHPLSVTLLDDGARLTGRFSYKVDFYRPETIAGLAADLERLLDAVASDPSRRLSQLPVSAP